MTDNTNYNFLTGAAIGTVCHISLPVSLLPAGIFCAGMPFLLSNTTEDMISIAFFEASTYSLITGSLYKIAVQYPLISTGVLLSASTYGIITDMAADDNSDTQTIGSNDPSPNTDKSNESKKLVSEGTRTQDTTGSNSDILESSE